MLSAAVLMVLSSMLYSLRISSGSFPKPLSAKEERYYLQLAAEGDLEARNILIERNLRLVAHIMKKYYASEADQEDLISIGTIGLIKGISTFDAAKGARLATYAARCVENAILSPTRFIIVKKPGTDFQLVCSRFCISMVSMTAWSSSRFCCAGQVSDFKCWITRSACTSDTHCASISVPIAV